MISEKPETDEESQYSRAMPLQFMRGHHGHRQSMRHMNIKTLVRQMSLVKEEEYNEGSPDVI